MRFRPSRCAERNSKGRGTRGSQRKLTVLSLPGLLCDRSSSNVGSAPDGREAVRTPAKPSPRRRPSCSVAPRETHPAALQQTTTRHDDAPLHYKRHCVASSLYIGRGQYLRQRAARTRGRNVCAFCAFPRFYFFFLSLSLLFLFENGRGKSRASLHLYFFSILYSRSHFIESF